MEANRGQDTEGALNPTAMRLAGDQKKKAKKSIEGAAIDMSSSSQLSVQSA